MSTDKRKKGANSTLFIGIGLILLALCSFTGCLFLYFHGQDSATKNAAIIFSYSNQSSSLMVDSSMPITDAVGKKLDFNSNQTKYGYSEFSLSANMEGTNSVKYEIYAIPVGVAAELPSNYIKVYLTDLEDDKPLDGYDGNNVPTYHDLRVATSDPAGKKIYSGILNKDEVEDFRLRMWLMDTYPITTEIRSFGISLYVKVKD